MSKTPSLNQIDDDTFEEEVLVPSDEDAEPARPYDSRLIRVEPKMFSLRNIMDMIEDDEIDLAPDFQRLSVWTAKQKSRLIESILLRIPLPAFYFASDEEGNLQVVDGVQRLTTIYQFVRENSFPLVQLEYLKDEVGGRRFDYLSESIWAKRINNTQIVANVIDPQTPLRVKFDIFKRINTGGTPLNSQEIRHCMSGDKSRALLLELTSTEEFNRATGETLRSHVRMADREMALRVVAFVLLSLQGFYESDGLDDFLNKATHAIDTQLSPVESRKMIARFTRAMGIAYRIFGDHAFRKWPNHESKKSPINRAIFEALGVVLYETPENELRPFEEIKERFRQLCTSDTDFLASVTQSTGSPSSVAIRFYKLEEVVQR